MSNIGEQISLLHFYPVTGRDQSCSLGLLETHFNAELFLIDCHTHFGEGSEVERRTPEREVRGSKPTSTMLCP